MIRAKTGQLVEKKESAPSENKEQEGTNVAKSVEIIKMLKEQVFHMKGIDDTIQRQTKIVCTLGEINKSVEQIKNMMEAGMDVARINMDYFNPIHIEGLIKNVQNAS